MKEERIVVLAPLGRDGPLACRALAGAGMAAQPCADIDELCAAVAEGAGAVLLTEEALPPHAARQLAAALAGQPAWSDLPLIVFGTRETSLGTLANVTLLDRPVRMRTLLSAARAALRARRRQYEVRRLLQELEVSVRERDQFLAMLGHELRNPLAAIVTATELIERKAGSLGDREHAVIRRQARHLARLVDDLLEVSRVTRGKIVLRREDVDLRDLVQQAVHGCEEAAAAQGVTVSTSIGDSAAMINADVLRLQQVLANLLSNAIKYTNAGGSVAVTLGRVRDQLELTVRDTGVGISAEMLPRIFDLFTQAPGSLDRAQGGMGIGLTLVQRLVHLHGGEVEAKSAGPGQGSEFVVRLPAGARPLHPAADGEQAPPQPRRLQVVIVEDNPDARDVLQLALEQLGHSVRAYADGTTAIAQASVRPPDAMLIDLGVPGADGYAVARAIRTALGSSVRLVALTGYGQPSDRERALEAGFDSFLVKPAEMVVVERALQAS